MNIYDMTFDRLVEYFESIGEKKFRANQIFEWLYQKKIKSFDEMSNIKKTVIEKLKEDFYIGDLEISVKQESKDGTVKFLFKLNDDNLIETVLMRHNYGNSVCVTTQLGCNMGCDFCASGLLKKKRDLTAGEIVMQVLKIEEILNIRVSHIVVMGIGEPFDNYDNMISFIKIINHPKGLQIGARHITVSTSGIVPKIYDYSDEGIQINLAISLHAANNELRNKLMPINKKYPLEDLIEAVKHYINKTNRRITFEYILLKGVNDSKKDAIELAKLIKGINAYVNLIPYNSVDEHGYQRVSKETALKFYDVLKKEKINVTLRREQGHDIDAACGQLRHKNN